MKPRTETFIFEFSDKRVWEHFFNTYFKNPPVGMKAISCACGDQTQLAEDALSLLQDLDEAGKLSLTEQESLNELLKH